MSTLSETPATNCAQRQPHSLVLHQTNKWAAERQLSSSFSCSTTMSTPMNCPPVDWDWDCSLNGLSRQLDLNASLRLSKEVRMCVWCMAPSGFQRIMSCPRVFFFSGPVNVPGIITQMHILIAFHWAGSAYKNVGHCAQRAK